MNSILLIGGSHGIGLEVVKQLQDTHTVYVASRTTENLDTSKVTHIPFDASKDILDTDQLPDTLSGLVYCPGTINLKPFKMLKIETFEEDLQINFLSLVRVVHTVLPKLKKSENASLVFYSTVAVQTGMPFHTSVAACKGAIEGFARSLAAEYAPSVRVNVIAPSLTNTPLANRLLSNDTKIEKMNERHPLKRIGTARDIASATVFLLDEKSSWVTGQVLHVDGGMSTLNVH